MEEKGKPKNFRDEKNIVDERYQFNFGQNKKVKITTSTCFRRDNFEENSFFAVIKRYLFALPSKKVVQRLYH